MLFVRPRPTIFPYGQAKTSYETETQQKPSPVLQEKQNIFQQRLPSFQILEHSHQETRFLQDINVAWDPPF